MRHVLLGISALGALAGCAIGTSYRSFDHKAGATPEQVEREMLECEVAALRAAPVSTRREVDPNEILGEVVLILLDIEAHTSDAPDEDVDVNSEARERHFAACLQRKSITASVSLPECDEQARASTPVPRSKVYPKLTERSCYVRVDDGQTRILTPR